MLVQNDCTNLEFQSWVPFSVHAKLCAMIKDYPDIE